MAFITISEVISHGDGLYAHDDTIWIACNNML